MFDSGISAASLIRELKNDVDVAMEIPNAAYVSFLNSLEQMLYADFIKEQHTVIYKPPSDKISDKLLSDTVELSALNNPDDEDRITFEDIYAVYINHNLQLIKTSEANGGIFPNSYHKKDNKLAFYSKNPVREMRIVYIVKPALKKVNESDEVQSGNVKVPIEFIELVKAKLRYEAYMLVNEYTAAANWVNVYNSLLVNFGEWLSERAVQFG